MSLREWVAPLEPAVDLIERQFEAGGRTVRVCAHERLADALDRFIADHVAARSSITDGDLVDMGWGDIRFDERDGELLATSQDARSVLPRDRYDDITQLLWLNEAWRAVREAAGITEHVVAHHFDTRLYLTRDILKRDTAVELRHLDDPQVRSPWFLGERPFDDDLVRNLRGSLKFAGNVMRFRPEVTPAFCLPKDYAADIDVENGITEIRGPGGAVVYRD